MKGEILVGTMYLISFLVLLTGLFFVFKITPYQLMTDIINLVSKYENKENTIKSKVENVTKCKKDKGLRLLVKETRYILEITNKSNTFVTICLFSVVLFILGMFVSLRAGNYYLLPIISVGFATLPFQYIKLNNNFYNRRMNNDLETALSSITTSYRRTDNIILAIEENLKHLKPPLVDVFASFVNEVNYVNSDVKSSLENLKYKIHNDIFEEWVNTVIICQENKSLMHTLEPIVRKFVDIRITSAELDTYMYSPLRDLIGISLLNFSQIPILYFLNKDWFKILVYSIPGKLSISVLVLVTFISFYNVLKITKPIEAKVLMEE